VMAGFVVAASVGREWEIENVVVAEEARRRGLGGSLMQALMERARRQGAESVFLEVRESNVAAVALYRKWGFKEAGKRKGYYSAPAEDGLLYRKSM
jgi:[ribosomal protein S18]-alanine N-acetyltransferase